MAIDDKLQYFQFVKDLDYPIYLACVPEQFGGQFLKLLKDCHFTSLDKKEFKNIDEKLKQPNARLLKIDPANIRVLSQIGTYRESDRFGPESTTPKMGHHIYRYCGRAIMIYSLATPIWEMGVVDNFGDQNELNRDRVVINRFLSWALSPLGVVGMFGLGIEGGIVVLGQVESMGEAVWIDLFKETILTTIDEKKLRQNNLIVRLDSVLKNHNQKMNRSELLSFLMVHNIFLSVTGPSIAVRQVLQTLSKICQGVIHPKESVKNFSSQSGQTKSAHSFRSKRPDVSKDKM